MSGCLAVLSCLAAFFQSQLQTQFLGQGQHPGVLQHGRSPSPIVSQNPCQTRLPQGPTHRVLPEHPQEGVRPHQEHRSPPPTFLSSLPTLILSGVLSDPVRLAIFLSPTCPTPRSLLLQVLCLQHCPSSLTLIYILPFPPADSAGLCDLGLPSPHNSDHTPAMCHFWSPPHSRTEGGVL